jgi:hypothetical protein
MEFIHLSTEKECGGAEAIELEEAEKLVEIRKL